MSTLWGELSGPWREFMKIKCPDLSFLLLFYLWFVYKNQNLDHYTVSSVKELGQEFRNDSNSGLFLQIMLYPLTHKEGFPYCATMNKLLVSLLHISISVNQRMLYWTEPLKSLNSVLIWYVSHPFNISYKDHLTFPELPLKTINNPPRHFTCKLF